MEKFLSLLSWGDTGWADDLARGLLVTLEISLGGYVTGLLIGSLAAWAKLRGPGWASAIANGYSTLCRAVPEVLLIIILYYAGQAALNATMARLGFENVNISGFAAATVVLGLVQGAYASEILRAAVLAVPRGQVEAAKVYGLHGAMLFRRIYLPAMVPYAMAGLSNLWMLILKDSTLISIVGYAELMFTAKQAAGGTKFYFSFYLLVAAIYYVVSALSAGLFKLLELRVRRWMPRLT